VSNSDAPGVRLNNAGTVNFHSAGTISITTSGAKGLDAAGTNMGTSTFDAITVTGSATGGEKGRSTTRIRIVGAESWNTKRTTWGPHRSRPPQVDQPTLGTGSQGSVSPNR
jgi:hypothetical protein